MKKRFALLGSLATAVAFTANQAYAGTLTTLSVSRPEGVGVADVSTLISAVFNVAIIVAIVFVFAMLILGGYGWLTAGGDKAKVEEARTRITNALIGLAIVASAWALITLVAQFFGVSFDNIEIPDATGGGGTTSIYAPIDAA